MNAVVDEVSPTDQSTDIKHEKIKMNIKCPKCGTEYEVDKKDFGRFVTCQSCGKGFVVGARSDSKTKVEEKVTSQGESRFLFSVGVAMWIGVAVLVLNLAAVVTMCCIVHDDFGVINAEIAKVRKSIDAMNEDLGSSAASIERKANEIEQRATEIGEGLKHMDESRHHDAEQIYDRMGRMKLY